jgi:hypothetical protein
MQFLTDQAARRPARPVQHHHIAHRRAIVRGHALALLEHGAVLADQQGLVLAGQIEEMLVVGIGAGKADLGRLGHIFDGCVKAAITPSGVLP